MIIEEKNVQLQRVNINLPSNLVERVKEYAYSLGINTTSAYIVLLNQALDQKDINKYSSVMAKAYQDLMSYPEVQQIFSKSNSQQSLEDKD